MRKVAPMYAPRSAHLMHRSYKLAMIDGQVCICHLAQTRHLQKNAWKHEKCMLDARMHQPHSLLTEARYHVAEGEEKGDLASKCGQVGN